MKIYLASPFFKEDQIERISYIEQVLDENNIQYFSPRKEFVVKPDATKEDRKKGFLGNCNAIDNSSYIIAVTDGKDMGTIWECGYAYGQGKPIIYFAETLGDNPFNLMLAESGITVCKSREELNHTLHNLIYDIFPLDNYKGDIE